MEKGAGLLGKLKSSQKGVDFRRKPFSWRLTQQTPKQDGACRVQSTVRAQEPHVGASKVPGGPRTEQAHGAEAAHPVQNFSGQILHHRLQQNGKTLKNANAKLFQKKHKTRISRAVQRLKLHTPNAGSLGLVLGQGLDPTYCY